MITSVKLGTPVTQTFTYFTDLSGISRAIPAECGPRTYALSDNDFFLTLTVPGDPFTTALTLTLQTDNDADIGPHTVTLTVTLDNYPTVAPAVVTFVAEVTPCVILSMVLAPADPNGSVPTFPYRIGDTQMDKAVPAFVQTPLCGYPVTVSVTVAYPTTDVWLSLPGAGAEGTVYSTYTTNVLLDKSLVLVSFTATATSIAPVADFVTPSTVDVNILLDTPICELT